jgi:hypothetical protein
MFIGWHLGPFPTTFVFGVCGVFLGSKWGLSVCPASKTNLLVFGVGERVCFLFAFCLLTYNIYNNGEKYIEIDDDSNDKTFFSQTHMDDDVRQDSVVVATPVATAREDEKDTG